MLQSTIGRIQGLQASDPIIITNEEHRFIVAEQLRQIGTKAKIILEPIGRNTAPAIALAAFSAMESGDDPTLLVLAADHIVKDVQAFQTSVKKAIEEAEQGKLVTFGIVPHKAETGYGYIHRGTEVSLDVFEVNQFVEKPDYETAQKYLDSGEFYWNSGCFMFKASTYLKELQTFSPEIYLYCQKSVQAIDYDLDFIRVDKKEFMQCPDDSVDYAVMEHTKHAVVVSMDAGWSDVGSWSALWDVSDKDEKGNVSIGDVILNDTHDSYIYAPNKLVAAVGIKGMVVIETKDAVLVAQKNNVQEVKNIVEQLKEDDRAEFREHREVYRPWGKSDAIDKGGRYKVNRITVEPGKKQSLQMHYHRAEHWVVVSGTAKVTFDSQIKVITENQSIYIPVGVSHRIENPGKIPLELIEIQSGSYLNEDDVIRFEKN
ncbi:mannose-1-phosphate guanylyltransferase/mannose-6-phosphate isomerase [Vibrio sp. CAIM 722]|uniref:mannose-1-phosphate guanylyltransferase n=1 Tax=Vibrio eleionomae TaxID=2653505 RepID=A0A7X4LQ44_9VIBR|nr:mannose-1-phosphate guanylyltransferase/mannose-6-phosphate isomerase [Vibrio eleionomae]